MARRGGASKAAAIPESSISAESRVALLAGIKQFNAWRFYDCHETLEDLWLAEETELAAFYQGIIKLAAGFHHLLRANQPGALKLLAGGLRLLEPFSPSRLGIAVSALVEDSRSCYREIAALGPQRIREFDRSHIPVISYSESLA